MVGFDRNLARVQVLFILFLGACKTISEDSELKVLGDPDVVTIEHKLSKKKSADKNKSYDLHYPMSWYDGEKIPEMIQLQPDDDQSDFLRQRLQQDGFLVFDVREYTQVVQTKMAVLGNLECTFAESMSITLMAFQGAARDDDWIKDLDGEVKDVFAEALKKMPEENFSETCPFRVGLELGKLIIKLNRFLNRMLPAGDPDPYIVKFALKSGWDKEAIAGEESDVWHIDGDANNFKYRFRAFATIGSKSKNNDFFIRWPNGTELEGEGRPHLNVGTGTLVLFSAYKLWEDLPDTPITSHRGTAYENETRTAFALSIFRLSDYCEQVKRFINPDLDDPKCEIH